MCTWILTSFRCQGYYPKANLFDSTEEKIGMKNSNFFDCAIISNIYFTLKILLLSYWIFSTLMNLEQTCHYGLSGFSIELVFFLWYNFLSIHFTFNSHHCDIFTKDCHIRMTAQTAFSFERSFEEWITFCMPNKWKNRN